MQTGALIPAYITMQTGALIPAYITMQTGALIPDQITMQKILHTALYCVAYGVKNFSIAQQKKRQINICLFTSIAILIITHAIIIMRIIP